MLSYRDYRDQVTAAVDRLRAEQRPVAELSALLGTVTAEPVRSVVPLPGFTNSAMDGYAVRAADIATVPARLPVVGDIPAGDTRHHVAAAGEAWRIMTGAPVPDGADTVVQVEATDGGLDTVTIEQTFALGTAIRRAGEDVQPGDEVLAANTLLQPRHLPVLAASGVATVSVTPRPRIAVVSTGEELVPIGTAPTHGQVIDSNGPMLAALALEGGFEVAAVRRVGDSAAEIRTTLQELTQIADLVVTTGGVSAGAFEPLKLAFAHEGSGFDFVKVSMQPGKPQGFGMLNGTPVFALPGNPVSSLVSFIVFVTPTARIMAGRSPELPSRPATAGETWRSPQGRTQFTRVVYDDDGRVVRPVGEQGSHVLGGLARSRALAIVPAEVTEVPVGQQVEVISLDGVA